MDGNDAPAKCPVHNGFGGRANRDWWPNQLNLKVLHQHAPATSPMDPGFDYAKAFKGDARHSCQTKAPCASSRKHQNPAPF